MVENITLLNDTTKAEIELDVTKTPYYILDTVDWGQVKSNQYSYKYVNQIGITVTGVSLETRDISISGWVIAKTELDMDRRKQTLNSFVNPQQLIVMTYKDYVLEFLPTTSIKYGTTMSDNNEVICKFKIDGLCPDPLFRKVKEKKVTIAGTVNMFHFPMAMNKQQRPPQVVFGKKIDGTSIVNVYNDGSVKTGMRIVFIAKKDGVVNPYIKNVITQEYIMFKRKMENGETITVNTISGSKKVTGVVPSIPDVTQNFFTIRDLGSSWLQLEVGDNLFEYGADEKKDNLEVYVYFYSRYLEVQGCY